MVEKPRCMHPVDQSGSNGSFGAHSCGQKCCGRAQNWPAGGGQEGAGTQLQHHRGRRSGKKGRRAHYGVAVVGGEPQCSGTLPPIERKVIAKPRCRCDPR